MTDVRSDDDLGTDVRVALSLDPRVEESAIPVRVRRGIVYLGGTVPSRPARMAAEEAASRVAGIRGIVNLLSVEPRQARVDAELASCVRTQLMVDTLLGRSEIDAEVANGVAYLRGSVWSPDDRAQIESAVFRVPGIAALVNDIRVEHDWPTWAVQPQPSAAATPLKLEERVNMMNPGSQSVCCPECGSTSSTSGFQPMGAGSFGTWGGTYGPGAGRFSPAPSAYGPGIGMAGPWTGMYNPWGSTYGPWTGTMGPWGGTYGPQLGQPYAGGLGMQPSPGWYGAQPWGMGGYGMTPWAPPYGQPFTGGGYVGQGFGAQGLGLGGLRRWGGSYSPQYTATGLPTDEEITEMVYDTIDNDPLVPWDADINVDVNAGEVTLSGSVPNKRIKHAVGDDAWWAPGVNDVHNQIEVSGRRRAKSAPQETPTTTQTRR